MKFDLVKDGDWFKPAYPSDEEKSSKIGHGEIISCHLWKKRNYQFHKKFFALIKMAYENNPYDENISMDAFRKLITMKAGYFTSYKLRKGMLIYLSLYRSITCLRNDLKSFMIKSLLSLKKSFKSKKKQLKKN